MTYKMNDVENVIDRVIVEIERARKKHRPLASTHEAYGVIMEELEEWWDTVKKDQPNDEELISVAAMAVLTIVELKGQTNVLGN